MFSSSKDKGKGGIGNVMWDHVTFFNVRRITPREQVSNEPLLPSAFMASYSNCSASPINSTGFYLEF